MRALAIRPEHRVLLDYSDSESVSDEELGMRQAGWHSAIPPANASARCKEL